MVIAPSGTNRGRPGVPRNGLAARVLQFYVDAAETRSPPLSASEIGRRVGAPEKTVASAIGRLRSAGLIAQARQGVGARRWEARADQAGRRAVDTTGSPSPLQAKYGCSWIAGDPAGLGIKAVELYCNKPSVHGSAYCEKHKRLASGGRIAAEDLLREVRRYGAGIIE